MITKKDIEQQINKIKSAQEALKSLDNLKINWETDISKMDFSKLRSAPSPPKKLKLTKKPLEDDVSNISQLIQGGDIITTEAINFIASGAKVIPPLEIKHYRLIDNQKKECTISGFDGSHRIMIARYLKLKEIPLVVGERIEDYCFSIDKWKFNFGNNVLVVESLDKDDKLTFNLSKCRISESNIKYLEIHQDE